MRKLLVPILFLAPLLAAMDKARVETKVDEAVRKFGVLGRDVLVAILDRGLDWRNNDFRNPDGTTRLEGILDLSDPTGANAPGNPYGGTLYTKAQINAALAGGTALPHRDAVGHGTTTTGIAVGNGRNSRDGKYRGDAPKAKILVVKIVAGAAAHDDQPEEAFFGGGTPAIAIGIDFAKARAAELGGLPLVILPNVGVVQGPMDGSSTASKKVDATVGPGKPGIVYVQGSSDDGALDNHAMATIAQGQSVTFNIQKDDSLSMRFEAFYPEADRYDVSITTPAGTFGPYVSPGTNSQSLVRTENGYTHAHWGAAVTTFGPITRRQAYVDFNGGPGKYAVTFRATASSAVPFHAVLLSNNGKGKLLDHLVPGYTVNDTSTAANAIVPNAYVLREKWANFFGNVYSIRDDRVGDMWAKSGIGPLVDGRLGIDFSAPGSTVLTTSAPNALWGTKVQDGNGFYTSQGAVSGANPQVTGIVALMLELNPTLDAAQVKQIFQQTARKDDYTGNVPNPIWGYGKLDALAAITRASQMPGARGYFSLDRNEIVVDYPQNSPAPANSSVTLTPGNGAGAFTTSSSASWLTVDKISGTAPSQLVVRTNVSGLSLGDYAGEITIQSADGKAVPQTITVHLHVRTPGPLILGVTDGAAFQAGSANGNWVTITGYGLSNTTRIWQDNDFVNNQLPTTLDNVRVTIQGQPAFPYFISPTQINVLAPDNTITNNRLSVRVTNNGVTGNAFDANSLPRNPEFFRFDGRNIAAVHLDGTLVGKVDLFPGVTTRPVRPGDTISLYGTGCGATNPVIQASRVVATPGVVTGTVSLTIGGKNAKVTFAGQTGSGLCQVNAELPQLPAGDAEVIFTIDTFVSADGAFVTVQ
jgi:uncharacterized protein (TIGR03437 family)